MTGVEQADQPDASLDEFLASADEAVLESLNHVLDIDAGLAAIYANTPKEK